MFREWGEDGVRTEETSSLPYLNLPTGQKLISLIVPVLFIEACIFGEFVSSYS